MLVQQVGVMTRKREEKGDRIKPVDISEVKNRFELGLNEG